MGFFKRSKPNISGMKLSKDIQGLIDTFRLESFNVLESVDALTEMGAIATEHLISALKDSNHSVRANTAIALGGIGDTEAVEPLIKLLSDENDYVVSCSITALGELKDKKAIGPLAKFLNRKTSEKWKWDMTGIAATALGEIGDREAVEYLIQALDITDWTAKLSVAEALGKIGDKRAIEPLIQARKDYPRDVARYYTNDFYTAGYRARVCEDFQKAAENAIRLIKQRLDEDKPSPHA